MNKGITTVNYTIWNKPTTVLFSSGANWQYSYDGLGKKLQERFYTATGTTVTDYIDNFVYKNDTLQYILTPVGRTLPDGKEEFFVKDHLGNIRSTIDVTTYVMQEYLASFEVASANLEGLFFDNIDEVRDENPSSTDPENEYSARLNGGDPGHEIGASLLMKVMTGDHINVNVNNFYEDYQEQEDVPLTVNDMLDIIVTTLKAGNGGWTGSESHNTNLVDRLFTPSNYTALQQIIDNTANDPSKPKAYLNYILFDEHLNIVPEMSGAYQANGNGTWTGIGTGTAKTIPTNGYFAVFLTNKSKITGCLTCGDVFFDQLVVQVNKSNLLEENAYYPYGLPIKGLSSTAFGFKQNKHKYQGNEYTEQGLNWMDFHNRQYDPQLGRFLSVDPLAASTARFSPYTGMNDNPVSMVDPLGLQSFQNTGSSNHAKLMGPIWQINTRPAEFGSAIDMFAALKAFDRETEFWKQNAGTEQGRIFAMAVLTGSYQPMGVATVVNNDPNGGSNANADGDKSYTNADGEFVIESKKTKPGFFKRLVNGLKDLLRRSDEAVQGDAPDSYTKIKQPGGAEFSDPDAGVADSKIRAVNPDGLSITKASNLLSLAGGWGSSPSSMWSLFKDRFDNFADVVDLAVGASNNGDNYHLPYPLFTQDTSVWFIDSTGRGIDLKSISKDSLLNHYYQTEYIDSKGNIGNGFKVK